MTEVRSHRRAGLQSASTAATPTLANAAPAASAEPSAVRTEQEIERLLTPGLQANAWRPDYEMFRQRRLWDENYHGRRLRLLDHEWRSLRRGTLLDVGTGRGGLAVALRRAGYRVVPLDLRYSCCRVADLRAQRYALRLAPVQARGEQLPFGNEAFAAVVCRDVLEHCQNPARVLGEIWRVLLPGGSCFATVINRWSWVDPHYHLAGIAWLPRSWAERYIAARGRRKESSRDRQALSDMHYYRYGEFVRLVTGAGFVVRDLRLEQLERYRRQGLRNAARWLRERLLRPFSLQAGVFEFMLTKPSPRTARRMDD